MGNTIKVELRKDLNKSIAASIAEEIPSRFDFRLTSHTRGLYLAETDLRSTFSISTDIHKTGDFRPKRDDVNYELHCRNRTIKSAEEKR
jgi:hypothetical protein